jgi:hypothetical protein
MAHYTQRFLQKIPSLGQIPLDYFDGAANVTNWNLARILNQIGALLSGGHGGISGIQTLGLARSWSYQTNAAVGYVGGFYDNASGADDFSPAVTWGVASSSHSAHVYVVTGAVPSGRVVIRVSGHSIDDSGAHNHTDVDDIVIPNGTPAGTYFEVKKFLGTVTIETVEGTPIPCNYGWSKYYDANNQDFEIVGLECLWESDSTDPNSDIELIHHKKHGWTYNAGGEAEPPPAVVSRAVDLDTENNNHIGPSAWKRVGLGLKIHGNDSEGVVFRIKSGSTGIGSLSYRMLNVELTIRPTLIEG